MSADQSAREKALSILRAQQTQAKKRVGVTGPISKGDALEAALARAAKREKECTIEDGFVHVAFFKYPEKTERLRWARTRDILHRCAPGPDEDGNYLEMIARQAASIEMVLRQEYAEKPIAQLEKICDHVLIATMPALNLGAFARRSGEYRFVQLSAGLIEFIYQVAKAVVLSWKSVPAPRPGQVSFKCEPADIDSVLAENELPLALLLMTIEGYLFRGLPRVLGNAPPPVQYHAPLAILTNFNERFVLAHEYGHTLYDVLGATAAGASLESEEFAADVFAFHLVVESGHILDLLPPNVSAQGAFFVLTALGIVRQALSLARYGEVRLDEGFVGHPPIEQRLKVLETCYLKAVTREDEDLSIRAAQFPAKGLEHLWCRLLANGLAAKWRGQQLHSLWETE